MGKFAQGYGINADLGDFGLLETFQHCWRFSLDNINACIRINHKFHHKLSLESCLGCSLPAIKSSVN